MTFTTGSPVRFLGMGPPPPGGSGTFSITGDTILMEAIGGGKPSQMIVPAIADGGTYASTTVTAATFSFGTGPDTFVDGTPAVPELSTWAMMLIGFAGLGYAAWRGGRNGRVSIIEA